MVTHPKFRQSWWFKSWLIYVGAIVVAVALELAYHAPSWLVYAVNLGSAGLFVAACLAIVYAGR